MNHNHKQIWHSQQGIVQVGASVSGRAETLGLLLAIPLFVVLLVLVREIYTNDLLGLQQTVIKIGTNARGEFTVLEDTLPAQVAGVAAPAKPAKVFSTGAESEQVVMSSKQG